MASTSQGGLPCSSCSVSALRKSCLNHTYNICSYTQFRIGIILAITLPRVPGFAFNQVTPLASAKGDWNSSIPTQFLHAPANFSFPAYADLQVDTNSNFLPLKFSQLNAQIYDLDTDNQVGTGDLYSYTVPAKTYTNIQIPLNFSYVATNDSDTTCTFLSANAFNFIYFNNTNTGSNWYKACRNKAADPSDTRPGTCHLAPPSHRGLNFSQVFASVLCYTSKSQD